jgi:hypothetical protein
VTITTGTPKKKGTYDRQAAAHEDTGKQAQAATHKWNSDTRDKPTLSGSPRARESSLSARDKRKYQVPGKVELADSPAEYQGFSETPSGGIAPGRQHPDEWRGDLNPNALAGQNEGPWTAAAEKRAPTAYDVKDIHRRYSGLADDDLKQIPVLQLGMRLQQGATYFDLNDPGRGEFVATGDMEVGPEQAIVPKAEVDYQLWNRVTGVEHPERLGAASEV